MSTVEELQAQLAELQALVAPAWQPTVFRAIWADELRLLVNGVDRTYFRGQPTKFSGYELQEPYVYGPADFVFPGISQLEVHRFGERGDLSWVDPERTVMELVPMRTVGGVKVYDRQNRVWAGIMTRLNPARGSQADELRVHCDGDLSGRLALRDRQPAIFEFTKDLGVVMYDACLHAGVNILPYLGPKTGIPLSNLGGGTNFLSFTDEQLAKALTLSGGQWTIGRDSTQRRRYRMKLKDRTTVHATVFLGAPGVLLDPVRDISEEPTTGFATLTEPNGRKVINAVAPNLLSGPAATYPFDDHRTFGEGTTDADTDTGAGVYALHRKLVGQGFMTRREGADNIYDDGTTDAVKALQRRVGLAVTGNVNLATWRRLFNVTETGRTLYGAKVLPWAQISEVQRFFLTANGSVDTANPNWDPKRREVDVTIDLGGGVWKRDGMKFMARHIGRLHDEPNWVASMTLDPGIGLFRGDVGPDTPDADLVPIAATSAEAGWNIKVVHFDARDGRDGTLFHTGGISVSAERAVRFDFDTRGRDLLTIGQVKARRLESRDNPARDFIRSIRRPNSMSTAVVWSEIGGVLDEDRPLQGGKWNKVEIPVGQSAVIEKLVLHLRNSPTEFVAALVDMNVSISAWTAHAGEDPLFAGVPAVEAKNAQPAQDAVADDPDTPENEGHPAVPAQPAVYPVAAVPGSKWSKPRVQDRLKRKFLMLYSAGQADQPLGRYPGQKWKDERDKDGNLVPSGDPITGDWVYTGGIDITTLGHGLAYLMIYPRQDCVLKAGQVLYPNRAEGS